MFEFSDNISVGGAFLIAKRHQNNKETPMGACDELSKSYDDLIDLSLGDPDLTTDISIIEAAFEDAKNGHTHYTDFLGDLDLRTALCEEAKIKISIEKCMITTSGCHAMWLILESILDEGDEVIIPAPYFTPYLGQVKLARGKSVLLETLESENFYIDVCKLEKLISKRTKAIIINTPNNPTGACQPLEVMTALASLARRYDILIIADDIYTAYHYDKPFVPMYTLYDKTVTIGSFSKDYCMTGWRIGYVIAPKQIIDTMKNINENNVFTAPSISQRAALYAIMHKNEIQAKLIACFKDRIYYAYKRIKKIENLKVNKPEGSIYLFVNIKETKLSGEAFTKYLLEKAHILVLPGCAFGHSYGDYVRIAVTVNKEKLKVAFDRMEKLRIFGGE